MKMLVLGIGNTLLTDEGIGIHVLQALEPELASWPDVTLLDGGTLSFTLAGPIEDADKSTVHEVGLTDLRAIALLAGHWPDKRAMLAIQPDVIDWGELPTPAVAAAIPPACAAIIEQLQEWQHVA